MQVEVEVEIVAVVVVVVLVVVVVVLKEEVEAPPGVLQVVVVVVVVVAVLLPHVRPSVPCNLRFSAGCLHCMTVVSALYEMSDLANVTCLVLQWWFRHAVLESGSA